MTAVKVALSLEVTCVWSWTLQCLHGVFDILKSNRLGSTQSKCYHVTHFFLHKNVKKQNKKKTATLTVVLSGQQ